MIKNLISKVFYTVFYLLNGIFVIIFLYKYLSLFVNSSLNSCWFFSFTVSIISLLTILGIVFLGYNKTIVFRILTLLLGISTVFVIVLILLKTTGILGVINNVQLFADSVRKYGALSSVIFIILQFLQVIMLPIPSFIMLGAGVLLFGAFYCSIYSSIGVILGSLCAFYIGRSVGYKTIAWFVGKKKIDKILNFVDGKDRLLFTFMFIFPMFPDDLLCFVAGLTKMSTKFFVKMIIVVRIIAISFACYSINNDLIPYDSSIGAIFWIIFLIFIIVSYFIIIKFCTKSKKSKN